MEARRVVRTEKQMMWPGGLHPHVAALVLEDGRRIDAADAIWQIDVRALAFRLTVGNVAADVTVERCPVCSVDQLGTTLDTATRRHLLALAD